MDARLERKLRSLAVIIVAGTIAGLAVNIVQGRTSLSSTVVGTTYGLLLCIAIGGVELFVLDGPMRVWLSGLSFTASLTVRSAIYAAIIMVIQFSRSGEIIAGLPLETTRQDFWSGFILSAVISVFDEPGLRHRQHYRAARVSELHHRAIVFNGDVMNTAARLEELSRNVEGGFLASRAAMQRFSSAPPFAVRDLGRLPIRGRADGIDAQPLSDLAST
jgi:hypothetical protein